VVDIMFGDFLTLTMDQMVNQAAKAHHMSSGHWKVPMVMRTTLGATLRSAAQHSQSLHPWFSHVPGLKVVLPSTPYDAKGLLKTAIRDENPVVFFEDKMMYKLKGPVPAEDYTIPLGVADVKRVGEDITFVATSSMVQVALGAANMLKKEGISAEVVDPRTTWPLDEKTIIESAKKRPRGSDSEFREDSKLRFNPHRGPNFRYLRPMTAVTCVSPAPPSTIPKAIPREPRGMDRRRQQRVSVEIPVIIWGVDIHARPFTTRDSSHDQQPWRNASGRLRPTQTGRHSRPAISGRQGPVSSCLDGQARQ
jgi:transketolase-like protein